MLNWSSDGKLYLRLLEYLKPYRKRFTIGLLANIPNSALDGAAAYLAGPFIDDIIKQEKYQLLLLIPLGLIAVTIVQGLLTYVSQYEASRVANQVTTDLRYDLFSQLSKMDLMYYKNNTLGDIITRYSYDAVRLQQAIVGELQDFIIQFFSLIFLACVLFYRNWQLAIVATVIISFVGIPLSIISKKIRRLDHTTQQALTNLNEILVDSIQGVKIIKAFNLVSFQEHRFRRSVESYNAATMSIIKAGVMLKPIMQMIAVIGVSSILYLGSMQVIQHHMTPGELGSFLVALVLMYKPVKTLASIIGKIQRILAPAERCFEKLDLQPEILNPLNPQPVGHFEGLRFDQVSFTYHSVNGDKQALRNVNLNVTAGNIIALVGPSGGGKSTLVDLIPRFIDPTEGQILFNHTDLRELSTEALRDLIAIVTQDTVLFDGTIRENIRLGRIGASEEEIREAARMAYLEDWINTLPDGLDHQVGEHGCFLSGGQKQRVAIARAFLKNAPLLILDEATSALDNESEAMIQKAMDNLFKGRTVFVIAHRLSTIKFADCILVLKDGEIVESGTHSTLLDEGGLYTRLYNLQFKHEQEALLELN